MAESSSDVLNIPHDRIGALIGHEGKTKKDIEDRAKIKLNIDSKTAQVEIIRPSSGNQYEQMKALEVIKAISRGFSPEKAFKLFDDKFILDIVSLTEDVSEKSLDRVRARIIGAEGKSRDYIAKVTGTDIVIYGKTVSVIGDIESVETAKMAIQKLIHGSQHKTVFQFLENKRLM